jgi:U3 small nucleolar RNA-associated protein 19
LYAFLDRDVLHSKHRARFFRLTELFLSSTYVAHFYSVELTLTDRTSHLPATLLASFIKRLARLSLSAPPAAIIMIIPFTYNTLKRHPALMHMIHRPDGSSDDPFDPTGPNPLLTRAIESSLWELNSHKEHYLSGVSTLTKIFSEAFTKPSYSMEDFLDHTYGTVRRLRSSSVLVAYGHHSYSTQTQTGRSRKSRLWR